MKTNYLKSTGLVLLGASLSFLTSFVLSPNNNLHSTPDVTLQTTDNEQCIQNNQVCLNTAQSEIAAYQVWLNMVPKFATIDISNPENQDSIEFRYDPMKMSISDWKNLQAYIDLFIDEAENHNLNYSYAHFPFTAVRNPSYYISRADLETALKDSNATGINVYLAMRNVFENNLAQMQTHLFVVPTHKVNDSTLIDSILEDGERKYVLDLTYPCPAMCDTHSPLYHPSLTPISDN